jgi:hypothetical protein
MAEEQVASSRRILSKLRPVAPEDLPCTKSPQNWRFCNVFGDYRRSKPAAAPQMLSKLPSRKIPIWIRVKAAVSRILIAKGKPSA